MELSDYIAILRRRKKQFVIPFMILFLATILTVLLIPPTYRSSATILVEGQGVPKDFVETTVTGFAEERIKAITRRLMTENKLAEIAKRLNLYPGEQLSDGNSRIINQMRNAITIETVAVEFKTLPDQQSTASVSFTVSFEAPEPEIAQRVSNELADLFLAEDRMLRTQKTEEVTKFLQDEAEKYRAQLSEIERKLAAFKQANIGQLPELSDFNLRFVDQTTAEIRSAEQRIRSLEGQIAFLQTQLAMTDPNAPVPIPSTLGNKPLLTTIQQLKALQAEYRLVREKYSPEHPDVKRLKSEIANLEQTLKNVPDNQGNQDRLSAADNPVYISLKAQLESIKADLNSVRQERLLLKEKLTNYEARLYKTPAIERDYLNLSRDYELAKKNYEDIQQKLVRAGLAQQLEEEAKGERFTLIEPAHGASPTPKRRIIAFLGFVLAFGSGIGSISITELLDNSVRGLRGITAILHAPPLAAIPFIETPAEIARKRNRWRISSLLITLTTVFALMLIHYYWMPINQLWSEVSETNGNTASNQEQQ